MSAKENYLLLTLSAFYILCLSNTSAALNLRDLRNSPKDFPPMSSNHIAEQQPAMQTRHSTTLDFRIVYIFVAFITGIISNAIVITTITYSRQLHSITNYYIISQCCADFLFAALVLPAYPLQGILGYWPFIPQWCAIHNCLSISLVMTSLLNLCAISIDRYLAICRPYEYREWMTTRFVVGMLMYIWFQPFLLSLIPVFGWRGVQSTINGHCFVDLTLHISQERIYFVTITIINFYIPATLMFILYVLIFKVAIRHIHNIEAQRSVRRKRSSFGGIQDQLTHRYLRMAKNDLRLLLVFVVLNGAFYLCWTPFMTFGLISLYHPNTIPPVIGLICSLMAYTNCTLNPVIHNFFNREIRSAFFKMICLYIRPESRLRPNTPATASQFSSCPGNAFVIRSELMTAKEKAILETLVASNRLKAKKISYI